MLSRGSSEGSGNKFSDPSEASVVDDGILIKKIFFLCHLFGRSLFRCHRIYY